MIKRSLFMYNRRMRNWTIDKMWSMDDGCRFYILSSALDFLVYRDYCRAWPIWATFSINSIHCCKSMPKSIKVHSMPSRLYSSCSRMNMWWLKNCWSFSLVKLIHNCSNPLYCGLFFWRRGSNTGLLKKLQTSAKISHKNYTVSLIRIFVWKFVLRCMWKLERFPFIWICVSIFDDEGKGSFLYTFTNAIQDSGFGGFYVHF